MTIPNSKCSNINPYQADTPREKAWQIIISVKKRFFLSKLFVEWYHGLLRMAVVQHAASSPVRCTYSETGFPWRLYYSDINYDDRKNLSKKKFKNFSFVISYLLLALSTRPWRATLQFRTLYNIWLRHASFSGSSRISRQSWKLKLSNIIVELKHHLGRAGVLVLQSSADTDSLNCFNSSEVLLWGCFNNMEF